LRRFTPSCRRQTLLWIRLMEPQSSLPCCASEWGGFFSPGGEYWRILEGGGFSSFFFLFNSFPFLSNQGFDGTHEKASSKEFCQNEKASLICFGGIHDHHKNLMRMVSFGPFPIQRPVGCGTLPPRSFSIPHSLQASSTSIAFDSLCVYTLAVSMHESSRAGRAQYISKEGYHGENQQLCGREPFGVPKAVSPRLIRISCLVCSGFSVNLSRISVASPFLSFLAIPRGVYLKPSRQY